uniref:Uncharacterized protein n=1 Tax=Mustela putorius furo TaxID=9669 RepID=M3XWW9_MUSPF
MLTFLRNFQLISKAVIAPDMTNSSVCAFQSLHILISTECGISYLSHSHRCLSHGSTPSVEPSVGLELATLRSRPELRPRIGDSIN